VTTPAAAAAASDDDYDAPAALSIRQTSSAFIESPAISTGWPVKSKPRPFCSYVVNNTIFMFEKTVVFCKYIRVITLLSNTKYCVIRISTNWNESRSSSLLQLPMTDTDVNIEYIINGIFNNSLKYYVLVRHSNSTKTRFIGTFWYKNQ